MNNFVSAALVQGVKTTTIYTDPIYVTLGNKLKLLSTKLANLSVLSTCGSVQTVWVCFVPKLSIPVIFGMDWLTQINPKINCFK